MTSIQSDLNRCKKILRMKNYYVYRYQFIVFLQLTGIHILLNRNFKIYPIIDIHFIRYL